VEGIYKTFDEFRRNQPFYTDDFEVLRADPDDNVIINRYRDEIVYKPKSEKPEKQHGTNRFFGYCENDTVYVAFWKFHPILEFGHLSLIKVYEERPNNYYHDPFFNQHMHQPMIQPTPPPRPSFPSHFGPNPEGYEPTEEQVFSRIVDKWFVLDYMTGDLYSISTMMLKEKFHAWDKELFKEYKKRKDKRDLEVQLGYLRKFNQRNPIRF
jgi:hypothetical protein